MKKLQICAKSFAVTALLLMLFNGCSLWHKAFPPKVEEEKSASVLLNEGEESLESGYYSSAIEDFQKITDEYPYSREALTAELKLADAHYAKQQYEEAYNAYGDYEKLHPTHPEIPYVIYRMALCNFNQMRTIDRDQDTTFKAKEDFERLIKRFPQTEYAQSAKLKVRECYLSLAEHELYVGNFYYKSAYYSAALGRYQYLLDHYPDLGQYHEALFYMAKCKEKLAEQEAQPAKEKPAWWNLPARIFN